MKRSTPLKRAQPLRQKSQHPAAKARRRERAEAKAAVKAEIERCIWPGCKRAGIEAAHGYGTGPAPDEHADPMNLWPMCRQHHRTGILNCTNTPELRQALEVLTDDRRGARQHGLDFPYQRIADRFHEAFGEILRAAGDGQRERYARYLRVNQSDVERHFRKVG